MLSLLVVSLLVLLSLVVANVVGVASDVQVGGGGYDKCCCLISSCYKAKFFFLCVL